LPQDYKEEGISIMDFRTGDSVQFLSKTVDNDTVWRVDKLDDNSISLGVDNSLGNRHTLTMSHTLFENLKPVAARLTLDELHIVAAVLELSVVDSAEVLGMALVLSTLFGAEVARDFRSDSDIRAIDDMADEFRAAVEELAMFGVLL
jgi:hypothetical protein